jgi:hypothetical protein
MVKINDGVVEMRRTGGWRRKQFVSLPHLLRGHIFTGEVCTSKATGVIYTSTEVWSTLGREEVINLLMKTLGEVS